MNPLTLVKRIQSINAKEADLGISEEASWHAKYKDSAYVFVGGIPYDLTEGDLLAVFAQYGELVDVNLVREKATGKSKGFAFIAYEDQRSTTLAVDNLNGAQIAGRIIRVDHVTNYKKKEEEDEETERLKREERGVCRAFQRGECKYGDSCKFSHDEQRAANTGWGQEEDRRAKWENDKFENRSGVDKRSGDIPSKRDSRSNQGDAYDARRSRGKDNSDTGPKKNEADFSGQGTRDRGKDRDKQMDERRSSRYELESKSRGDYDGREEKRSRRQDIESTVSDNRDEREKRSSYSKDSSPRRRRGGEDDDHYRAKHDDDYHRSHKKRSVQQ